MNRNIVNGLLVALGGTVLVWLYGQISGIFSKYPSFLSSTDFWVGAALMCFLGLVTYLRAPQSMLAALDGRRARIEAEIEEARRLREEAQKMLASFERRSREAEAEAATIVDAARRDAEAMRAEAKAKMDEAVERRTHAATARIAQAEAQALADVRRAAADAAARAAETILREDMTGETARAAIDRFDRDRPPAPRLIRPAPAPARQAPGLKSSPVEASAGTCPSSLAPASPSACCASGALGWAGLGWRPKARHPAQGVFCASPH